MADSYPLHLAMPHQVCWQSSCSLEDASFVTLCRDVSVEHQPIIGMLITYADQRESCVGQIRFDQKLERIEISRSRTLQLGAARTENLYLYVTNVWTEAPFDYDQTFVLTVPLEGTLVWRYSFQHTELYHSSLPGFWSPKAAIL